MAQMKAALGRYQDRIRKALERCQDQGLSRRLWEKDASLWKQDPEASKKISDRLGWLNVVEDLRGQSEALMSFARSVKEAGFGHVLLLGMGGSSLCAEVLRQTFGVRKGYPDLQILDSTAPAAVLHAEKGVDLRKTLFILASKSGGTIEMQSLYRYFFEKVRKVRPDSPGAQFMAITDPGTSLVRMAEERGFRRVFLNPPDIGGRYSALSYFGLVPAALIGIDLSAFLEAARQEIKRSAPDVPLAENPGFYLGVILGELYQEGRDKVTLVASTAVESFGYWAEQLLAESTGKEGKGLVPVEGEGVGPPQVYGPDRVFIYLDAQWSPDEALGKKVRALEAAGHPVIKIPMENPHDLAGQFFRWETATAVAGFVLGINPFDEPNVAESKENTQRVMKGFLETGDLPRREPLLREQDMTLYGVDGLSGATLKDAFWSFLAQAKPSDYAALMAYVERSGEIRTLLDRLRLAIRDRLRVATTVGFGPRFLHSTGQLHKGGVGNGLFLQITAEDAEDVPIPGEAYTFGILKAAQALGDFYSLSDRGLPLLEVRLGKDPAEGLRGLLKTVGAS